MKGTVYLELCWLYTVYLDLSRNRQFTCFTNPFGVQKYINYLIELYQCDAFKLSTIDHYFNIIHASLFVFQYNL